MGYTTVLNRARSAARRLDFGAAADHYGEAVRLRPEEPRIWIQYGHTLKETGRTGEAEKAYRAAIALAPHDADANRHLGHLTVATDRAAARTHFLRGLALAPSDADLKDAMLMLGGGGLPGGTDLRLALIEIGPPSRAESRRGRDVVGRLQVALRRWLARRAARAHAWESAQRHYRALLRIRPAQPAEWIQLGHTLKEAGRPAEAVEAYRTAATWAPFLPDAHRQLGYALAAIGERDGAEFAFVTALRLQPSLDDVRLQLRAMGWSDGGLAALLRHSWGLDRDATMAASETAVDGMALWRAGRPPSLNRHEGALWGELTASLARG